MMKDKKAPVIDEILNKVWKCGRKELKEWACMMCNRVWRGKGWSELLVLLVEKRGKGEDVTEYRRVTLMPIGKFEEKNRATE